MSEKPPFAPRTVFDFAIEDWREPSTGAVSVVHRPGDRSSDNGLLWSARFILYKALRRELLPLDLQEWFYWLTRLYQVVPGLYNRYPGSTDTEQHDDLSGVAIASFVLGLKDIAEEIVDYGETHGFDWNNVRPDEYRPEFDFGRIAGFVPFLRACASRSLSIFEQLEFALGCVLSALSPIERTGERLLQWEKNAVLRGRYFIASLAIAFFDRRLRSQYGDLRGLAVLYYGAAHPLARFAPEAWDARL